MGKPTVTNTKAGCSRAELRLEKKRTNTAAEEEKGTSQQNIKSYFGLKGRSQLWTTIDPQSKDKKKNLKLSTRKVTIQSKTESPYFVCQPELQGNPSLEKHHSPSVVHMREHETNNSKQKGFTKILETKAMVAEPEILQELALEGKNDMEYRIKKASLDQKDKQLLKGKSTPNGSNCDSRAYTDTNHAFVVNDVCAEEDTDFIPPTPSPVGRHSFINCQIQQLGKQGLVSLMQNIPLIHDSKDVCKESAVSNMSKETRLKDCYENNGVIEQSARLHKNGNGAVDTDGPPGLEKSLTCEDTEQSSLSPLKSQSTFKTSKRKYKLARKGKSSKVVSSPLKPRKSYGSALKSLNCQEGINENDILDEAESCPVTIAPSKCFILRSRMKRSAVKGSSPAQKRQQTEVPLAKKDEAKCNLWNKLDEMQCERDNVSGYLPKNLKLYNTSKNCGDTEDMKSCVTSETTCKLLQKEGTTFTAAGNVQNPFKLEGNNVCHAGKKQNDPKKEVDHGTTYLVYTDKEGSDAHKLKSPFKPKVVQSKSSDVCKDFLSPVKANSPQLNGFLDRSIDSLADAVELDSLLEGVEWSPMVISPNKLETLYSSSSKACKALFVPSKSKDQIETLTSDCAPCTGTAPASFASEVGYGRFLVLEVSRRETMDQQVIAKYGRQLSEKVLRLFDEIKSQEWFCCLREDWEMTEVEPGDIVHVTGSFDLQNETCILDNATDRYIVVHPDSLISGTTVSMATKCLRQSILNERFRTESQNEAMLIGTLLHHIFDMAMEFNEFLAENISSRASELLQKFSYLNDLYSVGKTENWALEKVKEFIPQFSEWGRKFKGPFPQPDLGVMDYKTPGNPKDKEEPSVCVSALKDIEENIWSPRFGLKGKVDATVEVKVDRRPKIRRHKPDTGNQVQTNVVPLELKTGKMFSKLGSVEHRAQLILYTLLMSDRYSESVDSGLLFYMKSGHMLGVPAFLHEKRALVMKRNEVARFMTLNRAGATRAMPAMLRDLNTCRRCPQAQNCTVFHKAVEAGDNVSSGLGTFFDEMTGHMTGTYMKYFADWFRLVCLEGKELEERRRQSEIWCIGSWEREKLGRCFSRMILLPCNLSNMVVNGRYLWHRFVRTYDHPSAISLQDVPITSGDRVVVSEEHGKTVAVAAGYIHEVTKKHVTVLLDRDLNKRYDSHADYTNSKLYRLDKDDEYNNLTTLWSNMAQLFKRDSDRDGELRRQIIDLQPPVFSRNKRNDTFKCSSQTSDIGEFFSQQSPSQRSCSQGVFDPAVDSILQELNTGQRKAVSKALCAQHYALILGMPGTGKTTTISCLVRVLVASGKTVLLTSYTHTAVDNILLKLKEAKLDFLRLGQVQKILPELQSYSAQKAAENIKTVDELSKFYESKSVVATTCLGVNHALFSQRSFDFCIVDEASQITQPVCVGPLRHARVFILVGDHYQLPPLVQSVEAREGGMDVSLFKRLSERHPQAVITLEHQYRMNRDIMELSNTLIYEHRLKCGTQGVARALLEIPNWEELVTYVKRNTICVTENWLLDALAPKRSVVFLDTDKIPAPENRSENLVCNEIEALLVQQLACALLHGGVTPTSLGIISPYRHQLKLITEILKKGSQPRQNEIEINTVDKYQGRDKSCIIVSLVRSNEYCHVGDLLRDWRRVNVAVTRAKQKLILIGSLTTLKGSLLLREMFDLLERRDWIQVLPFGAHKMNPFAACSPQASPISSRRSQSNCFKNSTPLISC